MGHTARKRFGQHFLIDTQIIQHLVDVIAPTQQDHLVEIGPGRGALTIPVLKECGTLDVVELDRDLIPFITERCKNVGVLNVYQADALQFHFPDLITDGRPLRVIGNLPYNISTPLIFHLLEFASHIRDMHFMLQKEVVDRMAAKVGSPDYGRLSIMVQYHCKVTALFDVPPTAFDPPPKVDSKIVKLLPYENVPFLAKDYAHFANIVKHAFNQRRKTLRNCLKQFMQDADWEKANIDSQLRPEQLTIEQYIHISNILQTKN